MILDLFIDYLVGDFDNSKQIEAEKIAGKVEHPFALHINRECTARIENLPTECVDRFVLEESYYTKLDGTKLLAPHLFAFRLNNNNCVELRSYKIPQHLTKETFVNSNKNLNLKFEELELSDNFGVMEYTFSEEFGFFGELKNNLNNGLTFTLTETIAKDRLEVMELMEKGEVRLTPYSSPIIYNRI